MSEKKKKFFLTQSALKDLEKDLTCPYRWMSQWLVGEIKPTTNEYMERGKYFENICLGGGAIKDEEVLDLPRLKNGDKSAIQLRIDEQAERFKRFFDPESMEFIGHTIKDTQIELKVGNRKGTGDFTTIDLDGNLWLIDLKLAADLTSTRTPYSYGNDWTELDLIQLIHYRALYYKKFGIRPRVGLLVFDYSPRKRVKFAELVISKFAEDQKELRFKSAEKAIKHYEKNGWVKSPSIPECSGCPLKCDKRIAGSPIVKTVVEL